MYRAQLPEYINFRPNIIRSRRTPQYVLAIRDCTEEQEFIDLDNDVDRIRYLHSKTKGPGKLFKVSELMDYLGLNRRQFYIYVHSSEVPSSGQSQGSSSPQRKSYIAEEDKQYIYDKIAEMARTNRSMSVSGFKKFLEWFIANKYGVNVTLNKNYVRDFVKRDVNLCIKCIDSLESPRCNVSITECQRYCDQLRMMVEENPHPSLVLNMDETGLSARIDKDTKMNCVLLSSITDPCYFEEKTDYRSMTVCVGVALDGEHISPLIISNRRNPDPEMKKDQYLWTNMYTYTESGFMNTDAMIVWIHYCLAPYVRTAREKLGVPDAKVFLIMDNMSAHCTDAVMQQFHCLDPLEIIWLPPHSSHLLQPLDCSYFGTFKKYYRQYRIQNERRTFCTKCRAITRALYHANDPYTIIGSWFKAGIRVECDGCENTSILFDIAEQVRTLTHSI